MAVDAPVVTDRDRRRVNEGNAGASALARVQVTAQGHERSWRKLNETATGDKLGEVGPQGRLYKLSVLVFESAVAAPVEVNEDRHDLTERELRRSHTVACSAGEQLLVISELEDLAKVIEFAKDVDELAHMASSS